MQDSGPLVPFLHYFGFGYAALVATSGIPDYAKVGSVPSLAAGLFTGILAGLGAYQLYQLSQDPRNVCVGGFLATSGILASTMGIRFYNSGKLMPAGLTTGAKLGISVLSSPIHSNHIPVRNSLN
ncbi:transmembrane protein 14C-like [Onychomys torridus]|uniref:transmembrane protein 14C-like n=1 Tax=Onychomys torridus TaxID=38674 RepID=UPI00167F9DF4|nr:transmembrane protein 14C-like [Onychomys torridus]